MSSCNDQRKHQEKLPEWSLRYKYRKEPNRSTQVQDNILLWGRWQQLGSQHTALCQENTHLETHDLFDLFKCPGFPLMHVKAKVWLIERSTMTNSKVNHLFHVTPGAHFTNKVLHCGKNSNSTNSCPAALFLKFSGAFGQTSKCFHVIESARKQSKKLTNASDIKPIRNKAIKWRF